MKIRTNLVSNSSSSSFIIGVGKIKKIDKFIPYLISKKIRYEYRVSSSTFLLENKNMDARVEGDELIVEASVNSSPTVSTKFDSSKEEYYFIVNEGNDEGDEAFWNPFTEKLEWSKVTEDYFVGEQKELIKILKSNFLEDVSYRVGAERNG